MEVWIAILIVSPFAFIYAHKIYSLGRTPNKLKNKSNNKKDQSSISH